MSKFSDYLRDRWDKMSFRDRQIAITSAVKAASAILQGTNVSVKELTDYADKILLHYWEFDELKRPSYQGNPAIGVEAQKANEEAQKVVETNKQEDKPF